MTMKSWETEPFNRPGTSGLESTFLILHSCITPNPSAALTRVNLKSFEDDLYKIQLLTQEKDFK